MLQSTYKRLGQLSNERLADTDAYWPVDHIRDLTIDDIELYYRSHITQDFTLPKGYNHFARAAGNEAKRQYLKDIGIRAARYAVIMFAYFDDERHVRALPMYSDQESRHQRDWTGSYHNVIVDNYYDRRDSEYGQGSFAAAGGADVIAGETMLLDGVPKPVSYLKMPLRGDLSTERKDQIAAMSVDFPMAKYVVLTKGISHYVSFDEGRIEETDDV